MSHEKSSGKAGSESHVGPVIVIQTTVPITLDVFFAHQLRWLREHGFTVIAVASPGEELDRLADSEGIRVHAIPTTRSISPFRDAVSLLRTIRFYWACKPTMVHGFTPKGGLIAMIAAWVTRCPVRVYTIFGFVHSSKNGRLRLLMKLTETVSCRLAHRVFCECKSIQTLALEDSICPPDKLRVLPAWSFNGVHSRILNRPSPANDKDEARLTLGIEPDALVVGYLGRIVNDKGIRELLEAFWKLAPRWPRLRLFLIGAPETGDPVPSAYMDALATDPRVRLTGFQWDVVPYLSALDILVHPSYREGLPSAPLEAAALGIPVIATRIPGNVDAIVDGVTGILVPPKDSEALAAAMESLFKDEGLRARLGRDAKSWAARECDAVLAWGSLAKEYYDLAALAPRS
jgi:glycosyltransferase involved in cell wall biosynthesis